MAAVLYENVFAVNASLAKARGYLMSDKYEGEDYHANEDDDAETSVCLDKRKEIKESNIEMEASV